MGNQRELLHTFLRELKDAPPHTKERAKRQRGTLGFVTSIQTARVDPDAGIIQVKGSMEPGVLAPITYSAPNLGFEAAVFHEDKSEATVLFDPLNRYVRDLAGTEVEVDTTNTNPDISLSMSDWDDWKNSFAAEIYRRDIYPNVLNTLRRVMPSAKDGRVVAVDLFGGDGEFAELLSPVLNGKGLKPEIHVIDANIKSLLKAKERLGSGGVSEFRVHDPIDLVSSVTVFPDMSTPPNLVTALGGLNQCVVTREEALKVAKKIYDGMAENGIFVATGYTEMRLNAKDFTELGFEVEQMTIPSNVLSLAPPYQMYVLRK